MATTISNGESGSSVRTKLNEIINKVEGVTSINNNIDVTGTVTADGLTVDVTSITGQTLHNSSGVSIYSRYQNNSGNDNYLGYTGNNFEVFPNNTKALTVAAGGDISFYENTGTTPKMVWSASAEALGIGTSSPIGVLETYSTSSAIVLSTTTTGYSGFRARSTSGNFYSAIDDSTGSAFGSGAYSRVFWSDGAYPMAFGTNSAERMRIGSTGTLTIGKTAEDIGTAGHAFAAQGYAFHTRDGNTPLFINRLTSDGVLAEFRKDGTTVGSIGVASNNLSIDTNGKAGLLFAANVILPKNNGAISDGTVDLGRDDPYRFKDLYLSGGAIVGTGGRTTFTGGGFYDNAVNGNDVGVMTGGSQIFLSDGSGTATDGTRDLGASNRRLQDIYATNGTIQTSDRNEKQDIAELTDAEQRVAVAAKGLLRKFRWKDAVAEKGDEARTHFGIIAQDLQAAFAAEGLDAGDYAMFIHSTWTDEETGEEKSRMGVRYSELLAFIIAAI